MDTKQEKILQTALMLFFRHGYRKVNMSDIAEAAAMSRPSLYAAFKNKEAIFAAAIQRQQQINHDATAARLQQAHGLEQQLICLFDIWLIEPVLAVLDSENATDMIANCMQYAPEAITALYAEFEQELEQVLEPEIPPGLAISAKDMAFILRTATTSLKASTENEPHLRRMVKGLITMAVATVSQG